QAVGVLTRIEISRRPVTQLISGVPSRLARAKRTSRPPRLSGSLFVVLSWKPTLPSTAVFFFTEAFTYPSGALRIQTVAPRTSRPLSLTITNLAVTAVCVFRTVFGVVATRVTSSRSPQERPVAGTDTRPPTKIA